VCFFMRRRTHNTKIVNLMHQRNTGSLKYDVHISEMLMMNRKNEVINMSEEKEVTEVTEKKKKGKIFGDPIVELETTV